MKTLSLITTMSVFMLFAGNDYLLNRDMYCAQSNNGRTVIMHNGELVTEDVTLNNGALLKPDGTLVLKDGTRQTLTVGQCVDRNGKVYPKTNDNPPPKKGK